MAPRLPAPPPLGELNDRADVTGPLKAHAAADVALTGLGGVRPASPDIAGTEVVPEMAPTSDMALSDGCRLR